MSAKNGKPCVKCGANEWYKCGDCVPCTRKRSVRWGRENPDKMKERREKWRRDNPEQDKANKAKWQRDNAEKVKIDHKRWRRNNPDREKAGNARWVRNNPDTVKAAWSRRRTRQTQAGGNFTAPEWKSLVEHYGSKCLCCGRTDVKLTADHVIPVSKGGTSNIDNIQPLCLSCNSSKGDKTIDYRPDKGLGRWIQRKLFG